MQGFRSPITALLLFTLAWGMAGKTLAGPWTNSGDNTLRHHIQVLADAGVIRSPVTTWPVMWSSISDDLRQASSQHLNTSQLGSLAYVRFELSRSGNAINMSSRLQASSDTPALSHFGQKQRDPVEINHEIDMTGEHWAAAINATWAPGADNNPDTRLDGSYLSALLGNWAMGAGAIDRWWGPGWQSSLILGHNSRPVPGVFLQRNHATAFETPWLSWIGPWQLITFAGQLEDRRDIPDAKLLGLRLSLRPVNALELGFSRTAQWGGEGRYESLDSLLDLTLGKDNADDNRNDKLEEPGNQLAGLDWRVAEHFPGFSGGVYGQFIGEDEAGGAPSRFIGLLGTDLSLHDPGILPAGTQSRFYLEASETTARGNYPNYAYEHGIYQDGYRFRGRSLGAGIDNDSRMLTLAGQHYRAIHSLEWAIHRLQINRDGTRGSRGGNPLSPDAALDLWGLSLEASHRFRQLKATLGLNHYTRELLMAGQALDKTVIHLDLNYRY